ncbi:MAG TPA: SusC/RagA family TonB-linked outer membrane protein [Flavisolibacter sp.]
MNCRKLLSTIVLPVFLLFLSTTLFAQSKTISGRVTDAAGAAVPSVTVTAKGQTTAATTNEAGQFSIAVPTATTTLVFSSVGFATREVAIGTEPTLDVVLQTGAGTNLNEVVVVAYGTRRRGDLTGSVTSVSAKDFQKGFIPSSEQLLQGKVAGLQITSGGGSAGGGSSIRIRGGASLNSSNEPLIVIDGVLVEGNGIAGTGNLLSTINPNDIESISVLKDASATALYGSRASNGVIIVTTKKGVSGKVRFNFNTQASVSKVTDYVDVLTGDQVRKIIADDAAATGNNTYKNLAGTANTNWQDLIYRSAKSFDNNLSASGALGKLPFRASLGFLTQEGVLINNTFDRLSGGLNLSPKLFDNHLSVNINTKVSRIKNNFSDQGAVGAAIAFDPTQTPFAENKFGGYYEWLQGNGLPIDLATRNPLALINLRDNRSTVNRFIGNVQADYKMHFLPDLHLLVNLGMDRVKGEGDDNIDSLSATNYKTFGRRSHYAQGSRNTQADVQLFYEKELTNLKTKVDVLLGHTYQEFKIENTNFAAFSYRPIADAANPQYKDTINGTQPLFPGSEALYRMESYLGRVNFNIADKYLITASLRRDASSKLAPQVRVGYFPSVAVAWKLKEEFFKNSSAVNDLKLRASWGETGQQNDISYYSYLIRYGVSNTSAQYQFGNAFYSLSRPEAYDQNIKWESTATTNVGMDFAFLKNRISGTFDYYIKKTSDLFADVQIAPGANFANVIRTNVGDMEVRGVEFTLNTTPVRTQDATWDLGFNIAQNKREITRLQRNPDPNFTGEDVGGIGIATGNFISKNRVGFRPNAFYVYKQVYDVNDKPIEGLYEDLNRDGAITSEDRYIYKQPDADMLLGLSTQFAYRNFSIGATAHGQFGNYNFNQYTAGSGILGNIKNPINFIGNASSSLLETGFRNNSNNQFLSDYFIQNASFFRLDNINLGYNVGKVFRDKATMRISGSIQNVAIITQYKGLDPEIAGGSGIDGNIYPRPRVYSLGVNLDF